MLCDAPGNCWLLPFVEFQTPQPVSSSISLMSCFVVSSFAVYVTFRRAKRRLVTFPLLLRERRPSVRLSVRKRCALRKKNSQSCRYETWSTYRPCVHTFHTGNDITSYFRSHPIEIEFVVGGKNVFKVRLCNNRSSDRQDFDSFRNTNSCALIRSTHVISDISSLTLKIGSICETRLNPSVR